MTVVRSFIAIDLSPRIRERLGQVASQLNEKVITIPIRWVPIHNIHLTLFFLGDVPAEKLETVKSALSSELEGFRQFEFQVGQIGAFPALKRPRVIWVGVDAPDELKSIHASIEKGMRSIGFPPENRPFSPHLTIGRVPRGCTKNDLNTIRLALQSTRVGLLGTETTRDICLIKSELQPTGAKYSKLSTVKLLEHNPMDQTNVRGEI